MYTPQQEQQFFLRGKELIATGQEMAARLNDVALGDWLQELREIILYADWRYYVLSEPVFADAEYDALFGMLKAIEVTHPNLVTEDSPTRRVAFGLSERFPPAAHLVPMLSLDNTYNSEDLRAWDKRVRAALPLETVVEYCVEPKYDGASISVIYEHDQLARGATRGDGVMGEEITPNVRQIRSVPLSASFSKYGIQQIEIRGEVVIHKEVFAAYNQQREREGLAPLANPRNAASGTLRILDSEEVRRRRLSAVLYHISDMTVLRDEPGERPKTHFGSLEWLHRLGFPTPVRETKLVQTIDEVIALCGEFEARRDQLPYEVDGLVIKVNSFDQQEVLGMTSHHQRWAVAYKFAARQATSKLRKVEFQVGRTGSITPVAKIEPAAIGGVVVTSVSLFNEDVVRDKDLRIGDTVLVERAGDVIPYIVKPIAELRDGSEEAIVFPTHCPVCEQPLERPLAESVWRCINGLCPAQVLERIMHYCSKDAMDIRGMGEGIVRKLHDAGIISDIPSLYRIDWGRVRALEGFKDKSVSNLQQSIDASRLQTLHRLIYGLGIRHVGETMAKTLAHAVDDVRDLYGWTEERLMALEDVGPKVAASIVHFFATLENRHLIDCLADVGVNLKNLQRGQGSEGGTFSGKTFLFTGTLERLKRSDAEERVEAAGGKILSGVSSKLNYLIVGADAGSKLEKAKKLGTVAILTEEEFLEMIDGDQVSGE